MATDFMLMEHDKIEQMLAAKPGMPIRKAEEMERPILPVPEQMDAEWKEAISNRPWATNYTGTVDSRYNPYLDLRDRLLSFAGEEASIDFLDEDFSKLQARGQLWYGDKIQMMPGEPSHCHSNSALLWEANKSLVVIATGYALSDDGMWRQHTWCVAEEVNGGPIIIETTEPRIAYFGFILTREEAELFLYENV